MKLVSVSFQIQSKVNYSHFTHEVAKVTKCVVLSPFSFISMKKVREKKINFPIVTTLYDIDTEQVKKTLLEYNKLKNYFCKKKSFIFYLLFFLEKEKV